MDLAIVVETLPIYLQGLWTTIWLVALSLIFGLMLAIPLAIARTSSNVFVNAPVYAFTYFFRGTPLLVQTFLIYYGSGQFAWIRESFLWPLLSEAWFCALLAFALNTGAYTTEILRGSIEAMPHGEIEAARAVGMRPSQVLSRVVLPASFRRALPAYGNEVIFMLHGSSVASIITIIDLTGAARMVNSRYYAPFEAFLTAGLFYLALTFAFVAAFKWLERRWSAHLRARPT